MCSCGLRRAHLRARPCAAAAGGGATAAFRLLRKLGSTRSHCCTDSARRMAPAAFATAQAVAPGAAGGAGGAAETSSPSDGGAGRPMQQLSSDRQICPAQLPPPRLHPPRLTRHCAEHSPWRQLTRAAPRESACDSGTLVRASAEPAGLGEQQD